jgi:hypothetical protein
VRDGVAGRTLISALMIRVVAVLAFGWRRLEARIERHLEILGVHNTDSTQNQPTIASFSGVEMLQTRLSGVRGATGE